MKHEFIAGDHVEWNSEGGYVHGTIMKQVTSAAKRKISTARHAPGGRIQSIPQPGIAFGPGFAAVQRIIGYADYPGALQRNRGESPHDPRLLTVSRFLIDYPLANRLVPNALDVLERIGDLLAHDLASFTPRDTKGASDSAIS